MLTNTGTERDANGQWRWLIHDLDRNLLASSPPYKYEEEAQNKLAELFEALIDEHYRDICQDRGIPVWLQVRDDRVDE